MREVGEALNDFMTLRCVTAERSFLSAIGGLRESRGGLCAT
jgi:hypothetical protein